MPVRLGLFVNPMSGRDVRRLAARASNVTHEAKMDMVARIAVGADQVGIDELYIFDEPFRISTQALAWVDLKAKIKTLNLSLCHGPGDTEEAMAKLRAEGVHTVVALGGDGTHRIITRCASDMTLLPLSTGTNNVFPVNVEPTIAGMAAALAARGEIDSSDSTLQSPCKVIHLELQNGNKDIALIDAVVLENDFLGNFLPYDSQKIREMLLTCALPDSIGMSPMGGFVKVVEKEDDMGLYLRLGQGHSFQAPVSPGYFKPVTTQTATTVDLEQSVRLNGPGILAFDGDREHRLLRGESAIATIRRDGPVVLNVPRVMRYATEQSILVSKVV